MNERDEYLYQHEVDRKEKREAIARALNKGKTYKEIEAELGTSSATVSAVKKLMERR